MRRLMMCASVLLFALSAGAAELELYPTYENISVYVTSPDAKTAPKVEYRKAGDDAAKWLAGHKMTKLAAGRWASSIFMVEEGAEYEVRVAFGEKKLSTTTKTWKTAPGLSRRGPIKSPVAARPGMRGGVSAVIASAKPGGTVILADGDYYETIDVTKDVRLQGMGKARILGCRKDMHLPDGADRWVPVEGSPGVYAAKLDHTTGFVAAKGKRLFHYQSLDEVKALTHTYKDKPYKVGPGWFQDKDKKLYVKLDPAADPDAMPMQVARRNTGINVHGRSGVVIDGIELGYFGSGKYGTAIEVKDSKDVAVQNCRIHHTRTGVRVRGRTTERITVQKNRMWDSSIHGWPWRCNKAHDTEGSAIAFNGRRGLVARDNEITDFFNGVIASTWGHLGEEGWNADIDCYRNLFWHVNDDPMEPEGTCINNRYYLNTAVRSHQGISLCPITMGPVYVFKNLFYDFTAGGFKVSNKSKGEVYCYFNTVHTAAPKKNGMGSSGPWDNMHWRNNIIMATRYTVEDYTPKPKSTWDYNCHFSTMDGVLMKIENKRYKTIKEVADAKGWERNGINANPLFVNAVAEDFHLKPASPCIDKGVAIPGLYLAVKGKAPDMGCFELGSDLEPPAVPAEAKKK